MRKPSVVGFFVLFVLGLCLGTAAPAAAAPVTVFDDEGRVSQSTLEATAAPIEDVEFAVIVVQGSQSLETDLDERGFAESDFPANTVALIINTTTRDVGVYKPDDHLDRVDTEAVIDEMFPDLRKRDWTEAIAVGMQAVDDQLHPSRTWLWVLGGLVVAAAGFFGAAAVVRSMRRRREQAEADAARAAQTAANAATVVELRRRLDELAVLILTVADGPARDPLEVKLNDVEVAVRAKEETGTSTLAPEVDRDRLAALTVALDSVASSLVVLRQDSGWQDRWRDQVAEITAQARELARDQEAVGVTEGFVPLDVPAALQRLAALLDPVLAGTFPIADAVAQLAILSVQVMQKENEADRLLDFRREQQRRERVAAQAQRVRESTLTWSDDEGDATDGFWGSSGSGGGYRRASESSGWSWWGGGSSGGSSSRSSSSSSRRRSSSSRSFSSRRSGSSRSSSSRRSGSSRRF